MRTTLLSITPGEVPGNKFAIADVVESTAALAVLSIPEIIGHKYLYAR